MAQLYPDEHAQALAELRSCSWHVPEHTIAQLIGFDGDVQNLRAWVRKLKMSGMDIVAFNAYEDKTGGDRERWKHWFLILTIVGLNQPWWRTYPMSPG